ncbi:MAG: hypothetical protein HFI66_02285 [Lachnospiraceae bacterium]|nr:hypothetical protein [Lachnospiraceae bacterium]
MRDVVFEWYVPRVPDRKQQLIKAVILSAVIVFFVDAYFFAAIMLIPDLILAAVGFFLFRSWKIEYEYEYVSGDLTISKIIHKSKRKELFRGSRAEITGIERGRAARTGCAARDFTSNRANAPALTVFAGGEMLYVEPNDQFEEEMKRYYRF